VATTTLVIVVVGALASALLVAAVVMVAAQRVRRAIDEASRSLGRVTSRLAEFEGHQVVRSQELERIQHQLDALAEQRAARRG